MKLFTLLVFLLSNYCFTFGQTPISQKRSIDTSDFTGWPFVAEAAISPNGHFAMYEIHNYPKSAFNLVVINTENRAQFRISNVISRNALFTQSSEKLIFGLNDTISILRLRDYTLTNFPYSRSFKLSTGVLDQYIAFFSKNNPHSLQILNLKNEILSNQDSVLNFWFLKNSNILILEKSHSNGKVISVELYNPISSMSIVITNKSDEIAQIIFSKGNDKIAYTTKGPNKYSTEVYLYDIPKNKVEKIVLPVDTANGYTFSSLIKFSQDNTRLFVTLNRIKQKAVPSFVKPGLDVWSFFDKKLQSKQQQDRIPQTYQAAFNIFTGNLKLIEENEERAIENYKDEYFDDQFKLVYERQGSNDESVWNQYSAAKVSLKSTLTNYKIGINGKNKITNISSYILSPNNKYVIFYDPLSANYYSYKLESGKYANITHNLNVKWTINNDEPASKNVPIGIACFMRGDSSLIAYEGNDIYLLDITGKQRPLCLTKGIGRQKNLVFRFAMNHMINSIATADTLILNAFDNISKENGFYRLVINGKYFSLTELSMAPNVFVGPPDAPDVDIVEPIRSSDGSTYIVRKMDAQHAPNYFITKDFIKFTPISDLHPEQDFVWMKSELVNFVSINGKHLQGILYKPENLKEGIRYPLIINCYERFSSGLNGYLTPSGSLGALNIPYFVSNGYLVFTPDISYKPGAPGASALDAVLSGINALSHNTWFDKHKIGIQGHSFGGFETLYAVTHTSVFSAAVSSAGVSDFIGAYGSLKGNGESRQSIYERTQSRMGFHPWTDMQKYLNNSAVLRADKVKAPILLINNINDTQVPFSQGILMFTSLRRLNKASWLLQYDGEGHLVQDEENQVDLAFRMKQFFDHYLKNSFAPRWMTEGISAQEKGLTLKYDLDLINACSNQCKVCKAKKLVFKNRLIND